MVSQGEVRQSLCLPGLEANDTVGLHSERLHECTVSREKGGPSAAVEYKPPPRRFLVRSVHTKVAATRAKNDRLNCHACHIIPHAHVRYTPAEAT